MRIERRSVRLGIRRSLATSHASLRRVRGRPTRTGRYPSVDLRSCQPATALLAQVTKTSRAGASVARWDVLDFLDRVLDHLPEPRQQLVRYWGWYGNPSSDESVREHAALRVDERAKGGRSCGSCAPLVNAARGPRRRLQGEAGATPRRPTESGDEAKSRRLTWSQLIRKVYEIDPLLCTFCGAAMRIVAGPPRPSSSSAPPSVASSSPSIATASSPCLSPTRRPLSSSSTPQPDRAPRQPDRPAEAAVCAQGPPIWYSPNSDTPTQLSANAGMARARVPGPGSALAAAPRRSPRLDRTPAHVAAGKRLR